MHELRAPRGLRSTAGHRPCFLASRDHLDTRPIPLRCPCGGVRISARRGRRSSALRFARESARAALCRRPPSVSGDRDELPWPRRARRPDARVSPPGTRSAVDQRDVCRAQGPVPGGLRRICPLTRRVDAGRGLLLLAVLVATACATSSGPGLPDPPPTSPPSEPRASAEPLGPERPMTTPGTSAPATAAASSSGPPTAPPDAVTPRTGLIVFNERCASCHADGGNAVAAKHFRLVDDKPAGHHAGSLGKTLRKVLGVTAKATMPQGGPALPDRDRDLLVAWADERDATSPPKPHRH